MTDPKEVADLVARLRSLLTAEDTRQTKLHDLLETIREQIRVEIEPEHRPEGLMTNIQNAVYTMRGRMPLMNDSAILPATETTLETLSSELERVKGERDALGRAVNKFAFERDSAEASLGVAVKALASAADAAKSFRDESGDAVAEQVLLRISPALASIQAKGE